ncbi:MAG: hypothetical protein DME33_06800 [Verrucomicrobia bacterium]|nr:MAG: hypothetical protein DME33_06800 [Verrucomicrobiota bacterium]
MIATWYAVVSFMLIIYIVLDGRNFGAGMLHWLVAKTPEERRQVIAAIGPLWTWHEVWLLGFGGTLIAIFPRLVSDFARYLARSRRTHQRSPLAGVLGFHFRPFQFSSRHSFWRGRRQRCARRST